MGIFSSTRHSRNDESHWLTEWWLADLTEEDEEDDEDEEDEEDEEDQENQIVKDDEAVKIVKEVK